jgi:hypothetical protein
MTAMEEMGFVRTSLFTMGGLLVWADHFGLAYAFNALACARRFAGLDVLGFGIVPLVVTAATLAALAASGVLFLALLRRGPARAFRDDQPAGDFLRATTIAIAGLSLVAIAWNGLPALIVPPCG